ncbi:MAG: PQQ-binding-like beta-propeller repeat protein [Woeseiaceae bacterium]|nr:PQQ-binding-like beta-propeller repeat protein [Woeseiaceae bacterium]NNL63544.1 PQQ-binding-like beta-propeller repeat protein [Woeseiaceae bacterium]
MNMVIRKTTGIVLGMALALVSGAPAIADDTELLLVAPADASQFNPNVMFILDTSGSMTTRQETSVPFDHTGDYSGFGDCDRNSLYWSLDGTTPVCDDSQTNYVAKTAFHCAAATLQIQGVGRYTGIMVQRRSADLTLEDGTVESSGTAWQAIESGNSTGKVECRADSGVHGDNSTATATAVYATAGVSAGVSDAAWTTEADQEVAWGSSGANFTYTMFDGNYLNYKNDPSVQELSRSQIMKAVTKTVLNSVSNMNVGIMNFNNTQGGSIIRAPSDLDTNRAAILEDIDDLDADGWTPLSETLFESALFWMGLSANYGESGSTDANGLVSSDPMVYAQPQLQTCAKNFNILITDGEPTEDTGTPDVLAQLPDYGTTVNRTDCTGTGDGACLDDIGEYLANVDIHATLTGRQSVITHFVGFTIDLDILDQAAAVSGGKYLIADDTDSLLVALTEIVSQVNERTLSFSAPAVSVNTFNRTRNLNDVFITMFGARGFAHWPGNLKAYRIEDGRIVDSLGNDAVDPATGFFYPTARSYWTDGQADGNDVVLGGAANELPDPASRKLYTNNGLDNSLIAGSNALSTLNSNAYTPADFGIGGASPTVDEMINWMRGVDVKDVDNDPLTLTRDVMGDPLHSRPAAIVYGGTEEDPEAVIFTATNDGHLHAVDASNGQELWSFVPKELLPRMATLYEDPPMPYKIYGLDGDIVPVTRDVDRDGQIEASDGDFAIILFGMRRGGNNYRAINVTNKNAPVMMWERALENGGQSWSAPVVARMDIAESGQHATKAVVVIGGGYDSAHDAPTFFEERDRAGAGVHILDLMSGNTLWYAGHTDTDADLKLDTMTRSIPTRIRVIDMNGDGFADRMYTSDLGGQLWRFDVSNGVARDDLVAGGVIAQLGAEGMVNPGAGDTRRFYNSPDVSIFNDVRQNRRFIAISIGSGYRAHPLNTDATDRFYSIRDPYVFRPLTQDDYGDLDPFTEDDLVEVSGDTGAVITADDAGWMLTLPDNQMVLADSVTFNDEVFFVSFSPDRDTSDQCLAGQGANFLWRVDIVNGDPIVEDLDSIVSGGEDAARRTDLAQGGIAPSPQFLFPSSDDPDCTGDECSPPPLGCIGVECFDPGFTNNPVRTLWTQDGIE